MRLGHHPQQPAQAPRRARARGLHCPFPPADGRTWRLPQARPDTDPVDEPLVSILINFLTSSGFFRDRRCPSRHGSAVCGANASDLAGNNDGMSPKKPVPVATTKKLASATRDGTSRPGSSNLRVWRHMPRSGLWPSVHHFMSYGHDRAPRRLHPRPKRQNGSGLAHLSRHSIQAGPARPSWHPVP
jgi:hypothetical protein